MIAMMISGTGIGTEGATFGAPGSASRLTNSAAAAGISGQQAAGDQSVSNSQDMELDQDKDPLLISMLLQQVEELMQAWHLQASLPLKGF